MITPRNLFLLAAAQPALGCHGYVPSNPYNPVYPQTPSAGGGEGGGLSGVGGGGETACTPGSAGGGAGGNSGPDAGGIEDGEVLSPARQPPPISGGTMAVMAD